MPQPDVFCEHTVQQNATSIGRGSAPEPAGGVYSASPYSLAGFKGAASWRRGQETEKGRVGNIDRQTYRQTDTQTVVTQMDRQTNRNRYLLAFGVTRVAEVPHVKPYYSTHRIMIPAAIAFLVDTGRRHCNVIKRSNTCHSAPSRHCHRRGAQVHGAHQAASHIYCLTPSQP